MIITGSEKRRGSRRKLDKIRRIWIITDDGAYCNDRGHSGDRKRSDSLFIRLLSLSPPVEVFAQGLALSPSQAAIFRCRAFLYLFISPWLATVNYSWALIVRRWEREWQCRSEKWETPARSKNEHSLGFQYKHRLLK